MHTLYNVHSIQCELYSRFFQLLGALRFTSSYQLLLAFTSFTIQCALYTMCTLYNAHFIPCTLYTKCALYNMRTLDNAHSTHCAFYAMGTLHEKKIETACHVDLWNIKHDLSLLLGGWAPRSRTMSSFSIARDMRRQYRISVHWNPHHWPLQYRISVHWNPHHWPLRFADCLLRSQHWRSGLQGGL